MISQVHPHETSLTQYADGPFRLEAALSGLTDSELNLALSAESWSIRQIVHHIADGDDLWKVCIKAALGNHHGLFTLQWYWDKPQMEWSENWNYTGRGIGPSLDLLHASRLHILELIRSVPNAWEKSIRLRWPDGREESVTVGDVLEMQGRHVLDHIKDIQAIRDTHGV